MRGIAPWILTTAVLLVGVAPPVVASFPYEGLLKEAGLPAEGSFDFAFRLFDGADPARSRPVGSEIRRDGVSVHGGGFAVELEIDDVLHRYERLWLEIEVARGEGVGEPAVLRPRQEISATELPAVRQSAPRGAVVYFQRASCPSGWANVYAAVGRVILGLPVGGTAGLFKGISLSDLGDPMHQHSLGAVLEMSESGLHNHAWSRIQRTSNGDEQWITWDSSGAEVLAFRWSNGVGNEGSGEYPLSATPNNTYYTTFNGVHSHSIGGATRTNWGSHSLPYLQLVACTKY